MIHSVSNVNPRYAAVSSIMPFVKEGVNFSSPQASIENNHCDFCYTRLNIRLKPLVGMKMTLAQTDFLNNFNISHEGLNTVPVMLKGFLGM